MRSHGRKTWVFGMIAVSVMLAGVAFLMGAIVPQAATAQSLSLIAKADGSYIRGTVTNSLTGAPLAGVYVELAGLSKAVDNTRTGANGQFSFPTTAHSNSTRSGSQYEITFAVSEFHPGLLTPVTASTESANIALIPMGVTTPEQPLARSGPRCVYVEWPANPEYNLKGYNVYRTQVAAPADDAECGTYTPVAMGEPVKLNGTAGNIRSGLITGTEYSDTTVVKGNYYVYQIQAISGGDRASALSEDSCLPVKGDFLTIFFPDVYVQSSAGLYLWEFTPGGSQYTRIPVSSRCAYDVSTSAMQIVANVPTSLISATTTDDDIVVEPTGVTAVMAGALEAHIAASPDPDVLELRIANASINAQSLYGAGDLFNVYVTTLTVLQDTCGPLHLLDEAVEGAGNGVRVYDDSYPSPLPVDLELKDGTLCKGGGCLHGDVSGANPVAGAACIPDGQVNLDDAKAILGIWVKKYLHPEICWPAAGDINRDGYVDSADSTLIQRWYNGLDISPSNTAKADLSAVSFAAAGAEKDASSVDVSISISPASVEPGDSFTASINLSGAAPTAGFEMVLAFPTGATGVTYIEDSAALGDALAGYDIVEFSGTAENSANGWVSIAVSGDHAWGEKAETPLVTLQFVAGSELSTAVPLVLSSFNQFDQYGYAPRQTDPQAPEKHDGSVLVKGDVEVPNVVGQTQAAATSTLEAADLVVEITLEYSSTVTAGNVIAQSPVAGTMVTQDTTVNLTVSEGPAPTATLTVVITPEEVAEAGAQWRVDGGDWKTSGEHTAVSVGEHVVSFSDVGEVSGGCFKPATTYATPANVTVTVTAQGATVTGAYTAQEEKLAASGDVILLGIAVSALLTAGRRARKQAK